MTEVNKVEMSEVNKAEMTEEGAIGGKIKWTNRSQ